MTLPVISIIIPVFNVEGYLKQCVDSFLNQSYNNIEIILVDDGSTDLSGKICDIYKQSFVRINVIHQQNKGSSAARNVGLSASKGEFVFFADSDDWMDIDGIEYLYNVIIQAQADIVISAFFNFNGMKDVYVENKPSVWDKENLIKGFVGPSNMHGGLWCKMFRKDFLIEKNISFPAYDYYEDMYVTIDAIMNTDKICYSSKASYHWRNNENSLTFSNDPVKRIRLYNEFCYNMKEIFDKHSLWNNSDIVSNFYCDVNRNKYIILLLPWKYKNNIKKALSIFPESFSVCKNIISIYFSRIAYNEGIIYPLRLLIKCSLFANIIHKIKVLPYEKN